MAYDEAMHRYEEQYDALKAKLQAVGFIGQGSVQTRRIACGSPTCRCHHDPDARHGPYHYWTRKARGKTVGLKLTEDGPLPGVDREQPLERLVEEMRRISSRVLALITGRQFRLPGHSGGTVILNGGRFTKCLRGFL